MNRSTRILYPRFQTESWPYLSAEWVVDAGDHLSTDDFEATNRLIDGSSSGVHRVRDGWWGVWHDIKQVTTEPRPTEIGDLPAHMQIVRLQLLGHTSLWDQQAAEQQATELVLGYDHNDRFNELAAVLRIKGSVFGGGGDSQRFTVNHEGTYGSPQQEDDIYLKIISTIIKSESEVLQV